MGNLADEGKEIDAIKQKADALGKEILRMENQGAALIKKEIALEDRLVAVLGQMLELEKGKIADAKRAGEAKEAALMGRITYLQNKQREFEKRKEMVKHLKQKSLAIKEEMSNAERKVREEIAELYKIKEIKKKHAVEEAAQKKAKVAAQKAAQRAAKAAAEKAAKKTKAVLKLKKAVPAKKPAVKAKKAKAKPAKKAKAAKVKAKKARSKAKAAKKAKQKAAKKAKPARKAKPKAKKKTAPPKKPAAVKKPVIIKKPKASAAKLKLKKMPAFIEELPEEEEKAEAAEEEEAEEGEVISEEEAEAAEEVPAEEVTEEEVVEEEQPAEEAAAEEEAPVEEEAAAEEAAPEEEPAAEVEKPSALLERVLSKAKEEKVAEAKHEEESAKEPNEYDFTEFGSAGISLSHPDWPEKSGPPSNALLSRETGNFSLDLLQIPGQGRSIDDVVSQSTAKVESNPGSKVLEKKKTGDKAFIVYSEPRDGVEFLNKVVFVLHEDNIFKLIFSAPTAEFDKINDLFWKSAKSISFK